MNDPIDAAQKLGVAHPSVQLWFLLLIGIVGVTWLIRVLREDLKRQAEQRDRWNERLATVVEANTQVLKHNSEVLENSRYQNKRSEEILHKFTT